MEADNKLVEAIYDMRDRMVRVELSMKRIDEYEGFALRVNDRIMETDRIARDALSIGKGTCRDVEEVKGTIKWAYGVLLTQVALVLTLISFIFGGDK